MLLIKKGGGLPLQLTDGEGEIGVGEGLVAQREVPPLAVEGLEAVTEHRVTENHAVGKLLSGDGATSRALMVITSILAHLGVSAEVGMALRTEPVEGAAHVNFLLCAHVEESNVDSAAAGVSALLHDVFLLKQHALGQIGIEVGLHERIADICSPSYEVIDTPLRAVGIVDFQPIAHLLHVVADGTQAVGCLPGEQSGRLFITIDALPHKIIGAEIAYFKNGIGHCIGECNELAGIVGSRNRCGLAADGITDTKDSKSTEEESRNEDAISFLLHNDSGID